VQRLRPATPSEGLARQIWRASFSARDGVAFLPGCRPFDAGRSTFQPGSDHCTACTPPALPRLTTVPTASRACSNACGSTGLLLNAQMSGFGDGNLVLDQSTTGFGPQPVIPPTRPRDGSVVSSVHCMNDPQPEGHMASHIGRRKFLATLG